MGWMGILQQSEANAREWCERMFEQKFRRNNSRCRLRAGLAYSPVCSRARAGQRDLEDLELVLGSPQRTAQVCVLYKVGEIIVLRNGELLMLWISRDRGN